MECLCAICGVGKKTEVELEKHIMEYHDGRTFSCVKFVRINAMGKSFTQSCDNALGHYL